MSESGPTSNIGRRRSAARSVPTKAYLRRRQELIEAAARVMQRKGFREMTVGDIAAEMGADRGSVYYYVAGKEELLAEVLDQALTDLLATMRRIARGRAAAPAKLRAVLVAVMEAFEAQYPYLYVWVYEDPTRLEDIDTSTLERITDLSQQSYDILRGIVASGIRRGEIHSRLPVGMLTQSILGLVAWSYRWYQPSFRISAQEVGEGLADLVISGLQVTREDAPPAES